MKNFFVQVWENPVFLPGLIAWLIAQVLKHLINWRINRQFSWERMVGSGGMPSSHSSLVVCATVMLGLTPSPVDGGRLLEGCVFLKPAVRLIRPRQKPGRRPSPDPGGRCQAQPDG